MARATLEAKDSPKDFEARLSETVIASRVEGPRHTPVQQGLNYLGLQQMDLQAEPDGGRNVWLWAESLVACPHESGPSLGLNHEISVFVDNAAEV